MMIVIPSVLAFRFYCQAQAERAKNAELQNSLSSDMAAPDVPDRFYEPAEDPQAPAESEGTPAEGVPLSADPPAYQEYYPDFYAPQAFAATVRQENTVYLTFDDGPSDRTDEILDILAEKDVKATFFVIGHDENDEQAMARLRRIVEEGHTLGMHSFSHDYPRVYASVESFLDEFNQIFQQIRNATGVAPTAFRFPGGSINGYDAGFYQEIISEMIRRGFVPYDWNVSSEDAIVSLAPVQQIVTNVVNGSAGKVRSFALFHDSEPKTTTVQALGPIIDALREQGFAFSAIQTDTLPVLYHYTY